MARKDRKQKKKMERQERLRKEKHLRHYGPGGFFLELPPEEADDEAGAFDLELPPETASERMLRNMTRGGGLLGRLRSLLPGGRHPDDNREQAQELAYDAMEAAEPGEASDLARRALDLDPDCTDALYTLALNAARSRGEQIQLLEQAVAAAERNLGGPGYFEENKGHFWGLLETRPYMRARAALADILRGEGRPGAAIGHYEALLDLNPNDNQGLRDVLIGCYFLADDLGGVRRLLQQYEGEFSAVFNYARVLERFLSGDREGAARARQEARAENPHVEAFLLGKKKLPRRLPDYVQFGHETEAIHCAVYLGEAWQRQPQALSWLKGGN
jgi:tetratricopeptide (TPR) repeat protein